MLGAPRFKIRWLLPIIAIVFLAFVFSFLWLKIDRPEYPPPVEGPTWSFMSFSDFLTMMSGEHFQEEGFIQNYTLPNMTVGYEEFARGWYYYQVPQTHPNSAIYYTHYGSLDCVINGVLRYLGVSDLDTFRRIAALISVLALALWYLITRRLFGGAVALISLLFMGTSLLFMRMADSIAIYSYDPFLAFGAAFLFLLADRLARKLWRRLAYAGTWALVFLQFLNSPEWVLWLLVFFIGYLWVRRGNPIRAWRPILVLASAPVAFLLLHFFRVAWALGSINNAFIDWFMALSRRTTGFGLAVEVPMQQFPISEYPALLESLLWDELRLEFFSMAALLFLAWWAQRRLKASLPEDEGKQLLSQWRLLVVFLIAGVAFWVVMIQATATGTFSTLRLILPFAGLLVGYAVMVTIHFIKRKPEHWLWVGLLAAAVSILILPTTVDRISGRSLDVARMVNGPEYHGRTAREVQSITDFVRENTNYGDIVITTIDTGQTGHPRYPFAGYEYLANRRFELARSLPEVVTAMSKLESVRQSLPANSPAKEASFFLLLDDMSNAEELGEFARSASTPLSSYRAIINVYPERPEQFYLYRLNPALVLELYPAATSEVVTEAVPTVKPADVDASDYMRLPLSANSIEVSSEYSGDHSKDRLVDEKPGTFWLIKEPSMAQGWLARDWVMLDLGYMERVEMLRVLPRKMAAIELWNGDQALWQGSNDRVKWTDIARLRIREWDPVAREEILVGKENDWNCFVLPDSEEYRYYRIRFGGPLFRSLAELQLYRVPPDLTSYEPIPIEPDNISASSVNGPQEGPENVTDGKQETFWHAKYPPESDEHWLLIDLKQPVSVAGIRIKPRQGYPDQLWVGPNAELQGSNDQSGWQTVSLLFVDEEYIKDGTKWLTSIAHVEQPFRHYRLLIRHSNFLSLGELQLLTMTGQSEVNK